MKVHTEIQQLVGRSYIEMDCYDLVARCYEITGNPIPYYSEIKKNANYNNFVNREGIFGLKFYEVAIPTYADIICFMDEGGMVRHIGFMLTHNQYIHSHQTAGVCISRTLGTITSFKFLRREC